MPGPFGGNHSSVWLSRRERRTLQIRRCCHLSSDLRFHKVFRFKKSLVLIGDSRLFFHLLSPSDSFRTISISAKTSSFASQTLVKKRPFLRGSPANALPQSGTKSRSFSRTTSTGTGA